MQNIENEKKLSLKNIYELLGEKFYIPAYQRGYRWGSVQVKALLDDISEFSKKRGKDAAEFYCLQPIVVAKNDDQWNVVDGQQRLTTIYLILRYFEKEYLKASLGDEYKKNIYTIEYETRQESSEFLQSLNEELENLNIDFFHISRAYQTIKEWFLDKERPDKEEILKVVLARPDDVNPVKVIWYDLSDECKGNDYAIDVFSRINIGKIPLTNAELVKALFLQRSHYEQTQASLRQIHIASEWDAIEKQLREPQFWHFISPEKPGKKYSTRIEYIFDLMKGKKQGDEAYYTFYKFNNAFKSEGNDIDKMWKEVKAYFLTFDEWYRDRELYHLVGFLANCEVSNPEQVIARLNKESKRNDATKSDFKNYLIDEIKKQVQCNLAKLSYSSPFIKKILLLFNVQTLLTTKEADARFPFDKYKTDSWDIEHIRSQAGIELNGSERIAWLEDMSIYFTENPGTQLDEEAQKFYQNSANEVARLLKQRKLDENSFKILYEKVYDYFQSGDETWVDSLGNLALLDASTNRSYKNALFPVKRKTIIQNDMKGKFVPICTKNVFLKYYSKALDKPLYWTENDASDYLDVICQTLVDYLPDQGGSDE